jgi:hypothetical protein
MVLTSFYYARFAAGKGSALVIDIGHSMASVTPVVDGFVLRKGMQTVFTPEDPINNVHARSCNVKSPTIYPRRSPQHAHVS